MDLFDHDVMLGGVLLKGEERKKTVRVSRLLDFQKVRLP